MIRERHDSSCFSFSTGEDFRDNITIIELRLILPSRFSITAPLFFLLIFVYLSFALPQLFSFSLSNLIPRIGGMSIDNAGRSRKLWYKGENGWCDDKSSSFCTIVERHTFRIICSKLSTIEINIYINMEIYNIFFKYKIFAHVYMCDIFTHIIIHISM